jgi:ABC-type iron transport system FetAB ATPase subunit
MADAPAQHPAAPPATVADVMQPPVTAVEQNDHAAAAAYLMKRAGATALIVTKMPTSRPGSSPRLTSLARSRTGRTRTTSGSMS